MKKLATLLLSISLLASSTSAFAAFSDMPEGEVGAAMQAAVDNGLLNGITETEIAPYQNITRAQMGTILVRAMGAEKTADISNFVDMDKGQWHYDYMSKAVEMGAFQGDNENKLNPENFITFQETFIVLSRIFNLSDRPTTDNIKINSYATDDIKEEINVMINNNPTLSNPFAGYIDYDKVADWAKEDFANILRFGYWKADDGYLRPTDYITRAEFAQVMNNLVQTYIDEEDVTKKELAPQNDGEAPKTVNYVTSEIKGNTVIRVSDCFIKNVHDINSDIYISDGALGTTYFEDSIVYRVVSRNSNVSFFGGYAPSITLTNPDSTAYVPAPPVGNIGKISAKHIEFATIALD